MDVMHRGIITLLKSAITRESYVLPEGFDLEQAYPLVMEHQISTLIYDGAVRCGVDRSTPTMQKLFQVYCKALMISEAQMQEVNRIYAAFEENQIDYMPLKGCLMKAYYPSQELRLMGDADILIRTEQYEKIADLMRNLGFDYQGESDHDYSWKSDTLHLELHKNLMPTANVDYHTYFGQGWERAVRENGFRSSMTVEDTFLFLFAHFAKHFRLAGIGCRHVVDLWVYLLAHPDINRLYLAEELEKLHLQEFYQNIINLLDCWFADRPLCAKMDLLTRFVFHSGSWGTIESGVLSSAVRNVHTEQNERKSKWIYIWSRVFPKVDTLRLRYPLLKKSNLFLPIIWVLYFADKIMHSHWSIRQHMENVSLITQDKLTEYQKSMSDFGFDEFF